ncbi:MAG TPA: DEAD/DEAH box helicase, partial [Desulfopila sp.]|nr:DEAD/DEAH box helicase [Desulfopila sp.]
MHRHRATSDYNVEEYLLSLKASARFGPQVVCHQTFDCLKAVYSRSSDVLSPLLCSRMQEIGVKGLYSHQNIALARISAGDNVLVATPTSSGKSMIYNLPVVESILQEAGSHALYLFPLKALSQDQLRNLTNLTASLTGIDTICPQGIAAIYDGDTTTYRRRRIREKTPPVIITNPDMLHLSFLPF